MGLKAAGTTRKWVKAGGNSRGQPTRGGPSAWGLGEVLTIPPCKKIC